MAGPRNSRGRCTGNRTRWSALRRSSEAWPRRRRPEQTAAAVACHGATGLGVSAVDGGVLELVELGMLAEQRQDPVDRGPGGVGVGPGTGHDAHEGGLAVDD